MAKKRKNQKSKNHRRREKGEGTLDAASR